MQQKATNPTDCVGGNLQEVLQGFWELFFQVFLPGLKGLFAFSTDIRSFSFNVVC